MSGSLVKKFNLSTLFKLSKLGSSTLAISVSLRVLSLGQYRRKCISSSTVLLLQTLQVLSAAGIFGLSYLPVSILNGRTPNLNLAKNFL